MRSLLLSLCLVPLSALAPAQEPVEPPVAPVVVDHKGDTVLRDEMVRAMQVWHDAGEFLVGAASAPVIARLEGRGVAVHALEGVEPDDALFLVDLAQVDPGAALGRDMRLLLEDAGQGLVAAPAGTRPREQALSGFHGGVTQLDRTAWRPVAQPAALTRLLLQAKAGGNDPRIDALVAAASSSGISSDVQMLSGNFSRNSTVASYIDHARDQIAARLTSMGYSPHFTPFLFNHGDNITVEIPGAISPDEWIVIGAHYDSRNASGTNQLAPGADDNGSGSAGVLEIARVLAQAGPFERSIRLMWYAGEEYGLLGSKAAAQASAAAGETILGMLNIDMTAYRNPTDARDVDFITNSTYASLNELCDLIGSQYVPSWASRSGILLAGTSDHASYFAAGYPAIFPFEDIGQHSPYIHSSGDTFAQSTTDFELALMITRGVLATAAYLAEPADLRITHTPLGDTTNTSGPYVVTAQAASLIGTNVTELTLHYAPEGGAETAVPMSASGGSWSASIPALGSPVTIEYYLTASDDAGNTESLPDGAHLGLEPFSFFVGVKHVLYATGFEGTTDAGWVHEHGPGPDDWKRGHPEGRAGDPAYAYDGVAVWGNDLGQGEADGTYAGPADNWLLSPVVNCSQASNVTLSFRRWLTIAPALSDVASLKVNGQVIWRNPTGTPLIDTSWVPVTIDISSLAAGKPAVQVEFALDSVAMGSLGGWNIDAFELSERTPGGGGCLPPMSYCTAKLSSRLCLPVMESTGTPSATSQEPFVVRAVAVVSHKTGLMFYGTAAGSTPFQGGTMCVQAPLKRVGLQLSGGNPPPEDCSGTLEYDFNALIRSGADPALAQGAKVYCQYWFRDPQDPAGYGSGLSDGLAFTICP